MKTWGSVPNNMTPTEAFKYCVDNQVLTYDDKLQCNVGFVGIDGTGYSGYKRLSLAEIQSRPHILYWFEGFNVMWTDVIQNPYPKGLRPFDEHSQEVKDRAYAKYSWCRRFTGTRDEVRSITSGRTTNG